MLLGVGGDRYDPESDLTCAQFITVAVRAIGRGAEADAAGARPAGYYTVAEKYGIIRSGEFGGNDRDRAMTRMDYD